MKTQSQTSKMVARDFFRLCVEEISHSKLSRVPLLSWDLSNPARAYNDDQEVLVELLGAVKPKNNLYAIVQTKHEAIFSNCGFQTEHRWTNYIKMIYNTNKNE